uniref:G patch domain and KOW motifs [Danio rerio] n=1 Tax=Lepeophtheirus salmonis TaxID=72036 RepID=A0A0K2U045_LEPSM
MSSFSFKFSQTREKVNLQGLSEAKDEEEEDRDYVREVNEEKGVKSVKEKEEKKDLIIPCPGDSLEAKAIQELLQGRSIDAGLDKDLIIYQESLKKAGNDATEEDYDSVPIEEFGMAMLKGMGWTPQSKKTIGTLEATLRPKGLGLGAAVPKTKKKGTSKDEEELEMVVGAYVLISQGPHKHKYAQINGFDEGTGRAIVQMALGRHVISISENVIKLVSKKEYKEKSKILNQDEYDRMSKRRSRSRSPVKTENPLYDEKKKYHKNGKHTKPNYQVRSRSPSPKKRNPSWAAPHLRIRYINERYKQGRYFNTKMMVQDVTTPTTCVLRSEVDGRILDNVPVSDLETVIPKTSSSNQKVMIVNNVGSARKGTLATILNKDKDRCKAVVQSIYDKKDVWNLDFDDLCEYLGELMEDY